jgi:hypothetical protein
MRVNVIEQTADEAQVLTNELFELLAAGVPRRIRLT